MGEYRQKRKQTSLQCANLNRALNLNSNYSSSIPVNLSRREKKRTRTTLKHHVYAIYVCIRKRDKEEICTNTGQSI